MLSETKNRRLDGKEDCYLEETIRPAFSFFLPTLHWAKPKYPAYFIFP